MTSDVQGPKAPSNRLMKNAVIAVAVALVLSGGFVVAWDAVFVPHVLAKYRQLGEDRYERLDQLWLPIYGFREANGRWPTSISELTTVEPEIELLMEVPHLAGEVYEIDFSVLGPELTRDVLIGDPGYDMSAPYSWRGEEDGPSAFRWALLADGDIVSYSYLRNRAR